MTNQPPENTNKLKLHALVAQARQLLKKAAARAKTPGDAELNEAEFSLLAKKVKTCPDDHHALGVDFVTQAVALHRNDWNKSAKQMVKLAALVLSDEAMKDELGKGSSTAADMIAAPTRPAIAGLQAPRGVDTKKRTR